MNLKKVKYFLYSLVIVCCLSQEAPFRTRSLKATNTIVNIYKQTGRTNTDKNMGDLFVRFLLY